MKQSLFRSFEPVLSTNWFFPTALAIVAFLIYTHTLFFGYTFLDDNRLIADNFWFISELGNIPTAFTRDVFLQANAVYYRPLLTVSFIIDAQFTHSNTNLFFFHLTNILLHSATTVVLFYFLVRLGIKKPVSFFAALVFAVHPINVQAVAWIPGRNDSLFALFTLLTLIAWQQYLRTKHWLAMVLYVAGLLLALFTKESAVVIPVLTLLYTVFWSKHSLKFEEWWITGMVWLLAGAMWFLARAQAVLTLEESSGFFEASWERFSNAPALLTYLGKAVIPINQSVLPTVIDSSYTVGAVIVVACVVAMYFYTKKHGFDSRLLFALALFLLPLLPTVFFHNPSIQYGQDIQLEHRMYLPLMGVLLFAVVLLPETAPKNRKLPILLASLCISLLVLKTVTYSWNFSNSIVFWEQAVAHNPNSGIAHRNLAAMYQLGGDVEAAKPLYEQALELNPNEEMVRNNLGMIAFDQGDYATAEMLYRQEMEINPYFSRAYINLANLYIKQDNIKDAQRLLQQAYELDPENTVILQTYLRTLNAQDPEAYSKLHSYFKNNDVTFSPKLPIPK